MPPVTFAVNQQIDSPTPVIEALIDKATPGTDYTFQLVVIDDAGHESQPVTVTISVRELPVAKIAPPKPAVAGKSFTLDASGSGPGQIKTYRWKLVSATPAKK